MVIVTKPGKCRSRRTEFYVNNNNKNNKLYLHDYNKVLQNCKSHLNLIIDYLIN